MPSFRFRRSRFAEERVYEGLEHEQRRREWAEKLAETGFSAGEHNMTRADHLERLLGDLLSLTEAHQEAALTANAVRPGDLRLYRHVSRIRAELDEIEAPPELPEVIAEHQRRVPEPAEEFEGSPIGSESSPIGAEGSKGSEGSNSSAPPPSVVLATADRNRNGRPA